MMTQPAAEAPTPCPNASTKADPWYLRYVAIPLVSAFGVTVAMLVLYKWMAAERQEARAEPLPAIVAPALDPALGQLTTLDEQLRSMAANLAGLSDKLQQLQTDVRAVTDKCRQQK